MGSCRKYHAVTNVSLLQCVCGEYEEEQEEVSSICVLVLDPRSSSVADRDPEGVVLADFEAARYVELSACRQSLLRWEENDPKSQLAIPFFISDLAEMAQNYSKNNILLEVIIFQS